MQVTKIISSAEEMKPSANPYTEEQLMGDLNYYRAEKLTTTLLENGLITQDQYKKIMSENRRVFRPFLSDLW